jgi:hypothetical protein
MVANVPEERVEVSALQVTIHSAFTTAISPGFVPVKVSIG